MASKPPQLSQLWKRTADTKSNRTEKKLSAIVWTLRNCSLDLIQFRNTVRAGAMKDSFEVMCRKCQDKFACLKLTLIASVHWTEIRKTRAGCRVEKKGRLNPINVNDLMIRIGTERMMITALHFQSINIQLHEWRTNKSEDLWHDYRFCICCPAFPPLPPVPVPTNSRKIASEASSSLRCAHDRGIHQKEHNESKKSIWCCTCE